MSDVSSERPCNHPFMICHFLAIIHSEQSNDSVFVNDLISFIDVLTFELNISANNEKLIKTVLCWTHGKPITYIKRYIIRSVP